jgi:hypothetical protein
MKNSKALTPRCHVIASHGFHIRTYVYSHGVVGRDSVVCIANRYGQDGPGFESLGAAKRQEREDFFNIELLQILRALPSNMIIGGDFNCVLSKADSTGHFDYSRALHDIVKVFGLLVLWWSGAERDLHTLHQEGATRLDKFYTTPNLSGHKLGMEKVVAAFTDHLAVLLRLAWDVPFVRLWRR